MNGMQLPMGHAVLGQRQTEPAQGLTQVVP
jgi:hypothetical protein